MVCTNLEFSRHAIQRMFLRAISPATVADVVAMGEVIESYPDDTPYPSALMLGLDGAQSPIHVVVGQDPETGRCIIITVYRPALGRWNPDFRSRRPA